MYKRIGVTAVMPAAGWISVAGRDRAASTDAVLQRAWDDWDKGNYTGTVSTLRTFSTLSTFPSVPLRTESK
jgi:hypothetical protein